MAPIVPEENIKTTNDTSTLPEPLAGDHNPETQSSSEAPVNSPEESPLTLSDQIVPQPLRLRWSSKKKLLIGTTSLVLLIVGVVFVTNLNRQVGMPTKHFTSVYTFVPEKLSKSAAIPINLPDGVDEAIAQAGITFDPEIEGEWATEDIAKTLVFAPKTPLKAKTHYAVHMKIPGAEMSGDFYVDEDPAIQAVFPASGTEAHETSDITIVFNRPMVALTTLEETESAELPISITPETKGRFKWISTRTLQFVPESGLRPSSDYVVTLKGDLSSVDGLSVPSFTHTFRTRPLRYEQIMEGIITYRTPVTIVFNQPVDLDKTARAITVRGDNDRSIPIDVEYGESTSYDWKTGKTTVMEDKAVIRVYQKRDQHGREHFWDFNSSYRLTITGADTETGTVPLEEERTVQFGVGDVVEGVEASSLRTPFARPDLLDPQGTLTVRFYEDIDLKKLDYKSTGIKDVVYGERCKLDLEGNEIWMEGECEKETDRKKVIFSFDAGDFAVGQQFVLELQKIYSVDGLKLNASTYTIPLTIYPSFRITKTLPASGSQAGAVDGMKVCSTVPLAEPGEEETLGKYISTSGYIVFGRWYGSQYIDIGATWYTGPCSLGEFETTLNYGLLPNTPYVLKLSLVDVFGQAAGGEYSFTTEPPKQQYTRFHNLQQAYNVSRPGRTKLTYAAENLESLNLHICKVTPETMLRRTFNRYGMNEAPQDGECSQVIRDTITLPPRYWVNNYFQIDLEKYSPDVRGHYIVTFSSPLYVDEYNKAPIYDRTLISVTNLAVGKKEVQRFEESWSPSTNPAKDTVLERQLHENRNIYWVSDSTSLNGIPNVSVTQYAGRYNHSSQSLQLTARSVGMTNGEGVAQLTIDTEVEGAVIRNGADTAIITDWADSLGYGGAAESASRTYIYTDRPMYRPGQTVYLRGIDRVGFDGSYEIVTTQQVPLLVYDSQGKEIYSTNLALSRFGTFNSSFEIPQDAPLGTYSIQAFGQSTYVSVEEYVPAAFKLEADTKKEEYVSGETVTLDVQADYYFGVPLDSGTVSYSITAQDYYFDRYTDEYFNFGANWYNCYVCGYGDSFIKRGEVTLNDVGHAKITEVVNLSEYFKKEESRGSKIITVSLTAKDRNGRSVSKQQSFIVHAADFYLGVRTDDYYTSVNTPVTLRVKSVDLAGTPTARNNIQQTVYKIDWVTYKRQEVDGGYYYRSEEKRTEISKDTLKTDADGNWTGSLSFKESGQYEVVLRGKDEKGNAVETATHLYIYGGEAVYVPPNNNYELDIEVQSATLKVGDTASVLIKSPYARAKVLITAERGTVYDYWIKEVVGGLYKHTFTVSEEYAPNVNISALLLSDTPEVKYGSVSFTVGSEAHSLKVDVASDKQSYLPGETVRLVVHTTDAYGKAVPAEVSLAVADLSVLALRGNPKKNPLVFFYDGFPLSVTTASNIKNILYEAEIPLGTKGGGGGDPDDLAKKQRGIFKDTAYWNASVETDQNGYAEASFTLPDNLTTWQIESLGVTQDTKLGVAYEEFTTKKKLMAVPLKPRFVVPGDTFSVGANIFNESDEGERIEIALQSDTLEFLGEKEDSLFINPGEAKPAFFEVRAPKTMRSGVHTFTVIAKGKNGEDSVKQEISITPSNVYETVATAHFTKDDSATEYVYIPNEVISDEGGLTINANATLAIFMTDALTYMAQYPTGGSEQIASSLSTIALIERSLITSGSGEQLKVKDLDGVERSVQEVVEAGLLHIYETQTVGGGISYYKGIEPNLHLTLRVALALGELKAAGFSIREGVLESMLSYIEVQSGVEYRRSPESNRDVLILAEYALRTVGKRGETTLTPIITSIIQDDAILNEGLNSMSLAYLSILTADGYGIWDTRRVYTTLTNRINIDGRGAHLTNPLSHGYYETPISDTALLLRAFVAHKDEHVELGNVLRWLLASRDRDGVWGNTQDTHLVVTAFIEYLGWQKETESRFTLKGFLKDVEVFMHRFTPENVFGTASNFIPMKDMKLGTLLPLTFERTREGGDKTNFYYDIALKYYLPAESVPPRDEGITIVRSLYALSDNEKKNPIAEAVVGDIVREKITLTIPNDSADVTVKDFIPAGFEIINFSLDTEDQSLLNELKVEEEYYYEGGLGYNTSETSSPSLLARVWSRFNSLLIDDSQPAKLSSWGDDGMNESSPSRTQTLRPTHQEVRDDRMVLYMSSLPPGVYEFEYFMRALVPGTFQHMPAQAEQLYFPEIFGRTDGSIFTIKAKD